MIDMMRIAEIVENEKPYPEIKSKILANGEGLVIELSGLVNGQEYRTSRIFRWAELEGMLAPYVIIKHAVSRLMQNLVEASRL